MTLELLGIKVLDFNSETGPVKGTQAFVAYEESGTIGKRTDKLFFRDGLELPKLQPGMTLDVAFNHRGKPEKVTVIQADDIIAFDPVG